MSRAYDMTQRAQATAETAERIASSTEALLASGPIADVTLQAIARGADVTVQTVLRHMGSREGCFDAVRERLKARIDAQRGHTRAGDVDGALDGLLTHYEAEGRLILNLVAQDTTDAFSHEAAEKGRAYHRAWVEHCFGPQLPKRERAPIVDALVVATDLSVWKLLRLDLRRSVAATKATMARLVRAVLTTTPQSERT
jgi:AcrR family transcriptional regulator